MEYENLNFSKFTKVPPKSYTKQLKSLVVTPKFDQSLLEQKF